MNANEEGSLYNTGEELSVHTITPKKHIMQDSIFESTKHVDIAVNFLSLSPPLSDHQYIITESVLDRGLYGQAAN